MIESTAVILAALIAAGAALWIGWLQTRALAEQNRIAAFDRRLDVFKDAQAVPLALSLATPRRTTKPLP